MDVLDGNLEAVEGTSLSNVDLLHEKHNEILENDAIKKSKEGKDVRNEVALIRGEGLLLVPEVLTEVDLLNSPKGGLSLLVHFPDPWVLNWKYIEAIWVLSQDSFHFFLDRRHSDFYTNTTRNKRKGEILSRSKTYGLRI
ncbi:hypothetical protein Ancab_007151 [Ancistrocladus abbreviatus]